MDITAPPQSKLDRIKIIQSILNKTASKRYLEIGVNTGACFLKIRANLKIAVDPKFNIPPARKLKYLLRNPANVNSHYFEATSDEFFTRQKGFLEKNAPDVVFIDGLHTYHQSYHDVLNSLQFLNNNGMIVMHDCNPETEAAAFPAASIEQLKSLGVKGFDNMWCGDVWKTIVKLRSSHHDLEVCVLNCDHGVGIIRKADVVKPALSYTDNEIEKMTYHDLDSNRTELLNLLPQEHLWHLIGKK